jgi:hypothetical protein
VKLLFDENISRKIIQQLSEIYPGCSHVDIVTLKGFPPKIILLRTGNRTTKDIIDFLSLKKEIIETFLLDGNIGCLELLR